MKKIKTNDFFNENICENMLKKFGRYGENPNLHNCPIYQKRKKIYSQNGEDGMLEYIFKKIDFTNKHIVEFGAGNGVEISNTFYLKQNYECVRTLIDGDPEKTARKGCDDNIICSMITSNNINELLKDVPNTYDMLSLDMDGDDYWIMKALDKKPRVIILEYHCGIPNDIPVACIENQGNINSFKTIPDGHINGYYGANLIAFYRLANSMGYQFVSSIVDNAIFVNNKDFPKLGIDPISEELCLANYFNPHEYWAVLNRDIYNREWNIV